MTDKQLLKQVRSFRKGILGNRPPNQMCYAVCAPLCGYLHLIGIKTEMVEVVLKVDPGCSEFPDEEYSHWVLRLDDGRIIDPTASQFNWFIEGQDFELPEVYIGKMPEFYNIISKNSTLI